MHWETGSSEKRPFALQYGGSDMASNPGQNVHLVLPHNHVVVSSSYLTNLSSQLVLSSSLSQSVVELSRHVVESSRRVVESSHRVVKSSRHAITRLFFNSSYYLSTRHVTFQLFVQRSRALFLEKRGDLRDLGTTTEQSNMAAVEPMDELKECLRGSVEMLLDKLNDRLHEDMDGVDYLCVQLDRIQNLVERASGLYDIPLEIVDILRSAQDSSRSLATGKIKSWVFNSTGCRRRPSFHIPQDMLQLYLDYQFSLAKIGQIFGVSSKTIQRRITQYDLKKVDFTNVSDNEIDNQM